MNKKKVDSILKGITAAGIAMGGVSSIQGADMVMAAINESAADSNSLVDAGSLSESERTEYSESTTQSMSESASESTSESESVSVSESESTSESSSISESAKQSDAEQQSGDNVVAATYTDDAEQDTAVYARMSGMPQLASNDTYRDGCVSNKVHHVTKITESNYSQYKGDTLFGTKYNLIQTKENHSFGKWEKSSCKYRIQNSNTNEWEYFNDFNSVTFNWTEGPWWDETRYNKTGELYSSKFQFHVIELSKLKSTKGKARKQELYRWAKLISASTWEEVREESEGNHYMEKVRDEMIKMSRDESERYLYLREQMAIRDKASQLRSAENRGRREGREEGREEGVREANLNNARNLKKLGIAIDVISQATGLSKEEIEKL